MSGEIIDIGVKNEPPHSSNVGYDISDFLKTIGSHISNYENLAGILEAFGVGEFLPVIPFLGLGVKGLSKYFELIEDHKLDQIITPIAHVEIPDNPLTGRRLPSSVQIGLSNYVRGPDPRTSAGIVRRSADAPSSLTLQKM